MIEPYKAERVTYLCEETRTTWTVYHPVVYFDEDEAYCHLPDESTRTGLVEHENEEDALKNAERLYEHYILDI